MLSFDRGKPFAVIRGGKHSGKVLKIHDGLDKTLEYKYKKSALKKLDKEQLLMLKDALETGKDEFLSGKCKEEYSKIRNNGDIGKSFHDDDCVCKIIPTDDPDQRDSHYITGAAGSGKSYHVSNIIEEYQRKYPDRPVIVVSGKEEDPVLDQWKPLRIPIDHNLVDDPVDLKELENSLVIFDDIDQLGNKAIQDAVWNLRDRILEVGRSKGISICTVAHQITNYKASRICLNESDYVVLFCKSGSKHQINYFLKNYAGLDKKQIERIMNIPSRAIILKKTYPMCIVYQNGCYIL